jgi:hypothetical protein
MNAFSGILSFLSFLGKRKKFWLIPIVIILLSVGALLFVAQGSVIAPFIYPLF